MNLSNKTNRTSGPGVETNMEITLKNIKYSAFASQETQCFEAAVYVDGKKMGTASNQGFGGPTDIHPQSVRDLLQKEADKLPDEVSDDLIDKSTGKPFVYRPDAESIVDGLLYDHLVEKDLTRDLKKRLVGIRDGKVVRTQVLKKEHLDAYLAKTTLKSDMKVDVVLNLLPIKEALALYKAAAQ